MVTVDEQQVNLLVEVLGCHFTFLANSFDDRRVRLGVARELCKRIAKSLRHRVVLPSIDAEQPTAGRDGQCCAGHEQARCAEVGSDLDDDLRFGLADETVKCNFFRTGHVGRDFVGVAKSTTPDKGVIFQGVPDADQAILQQCESSPENESLDDLSGDREYTSLRIRSQPHDFPAISMSIAIRLESLGKLYRLGEIGTGTLSSDFNRGWAKLRGRPDPLSKIDDSRSRMERSCDVVWALRDFSLDVAQGTILGIVGRNGAGKSTLLKMLSRITAPTAGRICLNGRIASLLEVGTGFHPELTGFENIYLNGAILGMTRQEITSRLGDIIEFSGCEAFIHTPVKRYSSGMTVRLGFAVAAYLECEILVIDEVLAVGDMEFQRKCIGRIRDVAQSGRTVLFVSHNMGSVETLCTHAIRIDHGKLMDQGSPTEVVRRYLDAEAENTQRTLSAQRTRHIKSVRLLNADGACRDRFLVGDTIIFEAELASDQLLDDPRFGFVISKRGVGRIATLHTDIQHHSRWSISGATCVRATWKNVPLNVGQYMVDASLWRHDHELETLLGCGQFEMEMRDIYGTGSLPDPLYQGHLVPDAIWGIKAGRTIR